MFDDPQPDDAVDIRVREFNCWIGLQRAAEHILGELDPRNPLDIVALRRSFLYEKLKAALDKLDEELKRLGKKAR
jgi:hypothetical protein